MIVSAIVISNGSVQNFICKDRVSVVSDKNKVYVPAHKPSKSSEMINPLGPVQ